MMSITGLGWLFCLTFCVCNAAADSTVGPYASTERPTTSSTSAEIDECSLATHNCHEWANCINTPGSYECECLPGYTGDGLHCTDVNECELFKDTFNCYDCTNYEGSFLCHCNEGFTGDNTSVVDSMLKYQTPDWANVTCKFLQWKNCSIEDGSCTCMQNLSQINKFCFQLDQCITGQHDCDDTANCINEPNGTYSCQCNSGFTGDGFNCTDINECEQTIPPCRNCTNIIGGYSCNCEDRFAGDLCEDIDECEEETHGCHPQATCTNIEGSYFCTCKDEYYRVGDNGTWCSGCPGEAWSEWMDIDIGWNWWSGGKVESYADGRGDFELLSVLKQQYPNATCEQPTNADAQLSSGRPYNESGNFVHLSVDGLYCLHYEQELKSCENFVVRFCCPATTIEPTPTPEGCFLECPEMPVQSNYSEKSWEQWNWVCEYINWRCAVREWIDVTRSWWTTSCSDSTSFDIENLDCPAPEAFNCCTGEPTCQTDAFNCEFCRCENGIFRDFSRLRSSWEEDLLKYEEMMKTYKKFRFVCETSSSCDSDGTDGTDGNGSTNTTSDPTLM